MAIISQYWYFFLALRPKQWVKNFIFFIPLVFSGHLFDARIAMLSLYGFILFSLFSGATYVFNDFKDIHQDKKHPSKKFRPLASGKLSTRFALSFAVLLLFGIPVLVYQSFGLLVVFLFLWYLVNTFLYTFWIKHIVILDIFSIGIGFVIRGLIGIFLINSEVSPWFLMLLFFGALWFGFLKRYQEVLLGLNTRMNITLYNEEFLKHVVSMITTCVIMSYTFYTFNSIQSKWMMVTVPFVLFGIIRYAYQIFFFKEYRKSIEEIIFSDRFILIDGILYVITILSILYLTK